MQELGDRVGLSHTPCWRRVRRLEDRGFITRRVTLLDAKQLGHREGESQYAAGVHRIINGDTPIRQRQLIVERFQRHLDADGGFDLLVLGTRAAGTGLTLTAATHVIHVSR